jgi:NADPH-dependent glutamate synthase beta subunit-like oxidoreductase
MGVEFKTGVEVGKDVTIADLRKQGYEAFYLAIGAQGGRKLGVPGEDAEGVISGVDFLRGVNLGKGEKLHGKSRFMGAGNVAIDVARTAVRFGAKSVDLYCLESRDIMPAAKDEIAEAEAEGIKINNGWGVKEFHKDANGKLTEVV